MAYPTQWNLGRYFYTGLDDTRLQSDIDRILPMVQEFAKKYKDTFHTFTTPEQIRQFYDDYSQLSYDLQTPSYYLFYRSTLDTQDLDIIKKLGEVSHIGTLASNELLFVAQGWKQIGYDRIMDWSRGPLLAPYRNDLVSTADGIKYVLSEREEYVLNLKSRPLSLANNLHDELTGSYEFTMHIDGEDKVFTEDEVRSYRQHADRSIRQEAYKSLRRVYNSKANQITLGNIYTSIVKDSVSEIPMRGLPDSVMSSRNISEQMDDDVVNLLLSEVEKAYPLYNRYLKAKARMMGLESDFHIWDIGAPLGSDDRTFTFNEAYDLHLSVMRDFDQEFYDYSRAIIDEERIDAFPRAGKRGGAYASYRKGDPSFVFLNFTGKLRDVSTISHELGHATHGYLSQVQEAPVYDSPLSMAETASIFAEMLLGERIRSIVSAEEYREYLNERLADIFATIYRQIQYILFEKRVHEMIASGQELTYKELNNLWREEQNKLLGNGIIHDVEAGQESGWSMIPHIFHTPFYCYAYAFGNLLTFALYNKVKHGELSVEDYKDILRAGGSDRPRDLLARYGIDIASPDFYRSGLAEVEKMVEEFEKLAE